jgi:hypothetical protein
MKMFELFEAAGTDLVEALQTNCRNNFEVMVKKQIPLFRGMSIYTGKAYRFEDIFWSQQAARTTPRKSQTDSPIFMLWTSVSEEWKNVPNRQLSTSCATGYHHASNFGGSVYYIVPFDSMQSYAYSPQDFNYFEVAGSDRNLPLLSVAAGLYDMQRVINECYANYDKDDDSAELYALLKKYKDISSTDMRDFQTFSEVKKFDLLIAELIEFFDAHKNQTFSGDQANLQEVIHDYVYDFGVPPIEWLRTHITPEKMDISVYNNIAQLPPKNQHSEIWFEGPYIAMKCGISEETTDIFKHPAFKSLVKKVLG